jgi:hypothetical protein
MLSCALPPEQPRRHANGAMIGARGRNRTGTPLSQRGILSPLCLPISPPGQGVSPAGLAGGNNGGGGRNRTGVHGFAGRCITTLPPRRWSSKRNGWLVLANGPAVSLQSGAGEESRTLDLNLGKVALYQLSYSRVSEACELYAKPLPLINIGHAPEAARASGTTPLK